MDGEKNCFCTIVTPNYIPYARALYESLNCHAQTIFPMFVLVADAKEAEDNYVSDPEGMCFLSIVDLCANGNGKKIFDKYFLQNMDVFRWSMKPVLINYLLRKKKYSKVIFLDCDLFFFNDYKFLLDLLDNYSVLLSPHFRSSDPIKDNPNYILQFNSGIYNGGFIAVNSNGTDAMDWFANVCSEICEINPCKGQYVDQSHLNLLPVFFDNIHILKHRGCNVATWNRLECRREIQPDNQVLINGEFPIIFIHFTSSTVRGIWNGEDKFLLPYFEQYVKILDKYGAKLDIKPHIIKPKRKSIKSKVLSQLRRWLN